jgi:ACS family glucarate transporter-like MFS transporter
MESGTTRIRWYLVFWLFILSSVAFLDRVNLSIAGSSIAQQYHLTNVQLGSVFSAFLIGYALFQAPGGWLADRLGPRWVLAVAVLWWGVFTALTVFVHPDIGSALLLLVSIRFLLGAGEAIMFPASNQFIARWIPQKERGKANGWIFAGVGVGSGITPPLITYIMRHYGWQRSFVICSMIGLAAGIVWLVIARDTPEQHPLVSPRELADIRAGLTLQKESAAGSWKSMKIRELAAITVSYFCYGYCAWIFFSWFYIYLFKVRGLNLKASAFYASLPFLAMAVGCLLGGVISDWLTRWRGQRLGRCGLAMFAVGLTSVFLFFGAQVRSVRLASVVLACGAGVLYLAQSSYWSVSADIGGQSSGSVSGIMNMGAQIGGAVTASLTPAIADRFGWTTSFAVAAALCILGALAWLMVNPERRATGSSTVVLPRVSTSSNS